MSPFDDFWPTLTEWMIDAVLDCLDAMMSMIQNAPEPDVTRGNVWFIEQYGMVYQMALLLIVPLALVATISALLKGGIAELLKTYLIGIPVAVLGTVVALSVITFMLKIDQSFTDALLAQLSLDYAVFVDAVANTQTDTEDLGSLFLLCLIFLFMTLSVMFVWLELIFRAIAIYLAVLFLPLGFAAYIWRGSRSWYSRLARMIVGLVMMKFLIVAALAFGFGAVRYAFGPIPAQDADATAMHLGTLLSGVIVFAMASLSGPTILALAIGRDSIPGMDRKEFAKMTPINADQGFIRKSYGALVPKSLKRR